MRRISLRSRAVMLHKLALGCSLALCWRVLGYSEADEPKLFDEISLFRQAAVLLAEEDGGSRCLEPIAVPPFKLAASPFWPFLLGALLLLAGYIFYGRFVSGVLQPDDRQPTPAMSMADGVDYVPLSDAKVFLIQLLNIAGLGPIFGPILGSVFGPAAFCWIVVGCIFFGAVSDYLVGMMSVLTQGASIPILIGYELGSLAKQFLNLISLVLLLLVGVVFVKGPAGLIAGLTFEQLSENFWTAAIFLYYIIATLVPVDKVIGRIYPLFGAVLIFMTVGLLGGTVASGREFPRLEPTNPDGSSWYPAIFITISCSAISGFHSTQIPMMARCIQTQTSGKRIFFGAMITEGVIGLIWAMSPLVFYGGQAQLTAALHCASGNPAIIVKKILNHLLGPIGGVVAIVGVIALPITSGDTAFRSARLIVAEFFGVVEEQAHMIGRIKISIPLFVIAFCICLVDFSMVWLYFNFTNQLVSTLSLWCAAAFLLRRKKCHWIATVPACFMTLFVSTYIFQSKEFATSEIRLPVSCGIGAFITLGVMGGMYAWLRKAASGLPMQRSLSASEASEINGSFMSNGSRRSSVKM